MDRNRTAVQTALLSIHAFRSSLLVFMFGIQALAAMDLGYIVSFDRPALRDDLLVPLAFRGGGLSVGALARWEGDHWAADARIVFGMGYVANRFGHGGVQWPFILSVFPSRIVVSSSGNGSILIGFPLAASWRNYYLYSWDDAHLYWMTAHWAGIGIEYRTRIREHWGFRCAIQSPLIAVVSRPPDYRMYKQDPLKNPAFHLLGTNAGLTTARSDSFEGLDATATLERRLESGARSMTLAYSWYACRLGDTAFNSTIKIQYSRTWNRGR